MAEDSWNLVGGPDESYLRTEDTVTVFGYWSTFGFHQNTVGNWIANSPDDRTLIPWDSNKRQMYLIWHGGKEVDIVSTREQVEKTVRKLGATSFFYDNQHRFIHI